MKKKAENVNWTDALGRPKQCIHRSGCQLVGLTHPSKNGNDRLELVRSLKIGTALKLVLEPNNPYDRNAVLIYRADYLSDDLGYLYSTFARKISRMMECGATFEAEVYWINRRNPELPEVFIHTYQMTPMLRSRRPTRYGVPTYKPPVARKSSTKVRTSPFEEDTQEATPFSTTLSALRFFTKFVRKLR